MNLEQFKGYIPPAVEQYIFELESENKRLHDDRQYLSASLADAVNKAEEFRAENKRLRGIIEEARQTMLVATGWAPACMDITQEAGDG